MNSVFEVFNDALPSSHPALPLAIRLSPPGRSDTLRSNGLQNSLFVLGTGSDEHLDSSEDACNVSRALQSSPYGKDVAPTWGHTPNPTRSRTPDSSALDFRRCQSPDVHCECQ